VRFFPAKRVSEIIGFVVGISIFSFSQTSQFMDFEIDGQQLATLMRLAERFNQPWSPLTWAGRGLVRLGEGDWLNAIGLLGVVLVLSAGIFYICLTTAERLYYTGWSGLQNNRRKAKTGVQPRRIVLPQAGAWVESLISSPVRAVIFKDWTLNRRDLRSMSRLLTPLIMGVVYAFSLIRSDGVVPEGQGDAPAWFMEVLQGIYLYGDVGLALFVGWLLAVNLAGSGISLEGKNFWMIKTSPMRPDQFLMAKYLAAYLPCLLLCGGYDLVLQLLKGSDLWTIALSLLATALILAGMNGIYLAFGVTGAKFDWDNPNQIGRSVSCLGGLAGSFYMPLCFTLFAGPPLLAGIFGFPLLLGQLVGLLLGGAAGAAGTVIPLVLVRKRVATLNEA
jgi:ABC-2 type transport system permease protein